jgi:hypothetical protein
MACLPRRFSELTQHKTVVDNHTIILQALKIWRMPNLTIRRGLPVGVRTYRVARRRFVDCDDDGTALATQHVATEKVSFVIHSLKVLPDRWPYRPAGLTIGMPDAHRFLSS